MYIYTCVCMFHGSRNMSQRQGCGASNKYTNIYNFYSVKYYKLFTKWYCR